MNLDTEPVAEIPPPDRSAFRPMVMHVLWCGGIVPTAARFVLFVLLANWRPGGGAGAVCWVLGIVGATRLATGRSLRKLASGAALRHPERAILPATIGFAAAWFFGLIVDMAVIGNSAGRPGQFILLSILLNSGLFAWQTLATQRTLLHMPTAQAAAGFRATNLLVPLGDAILVILVLALIVLAIS